MQNHDVQSVLDMLSYRRPARGVTEAEFIKTFILPLGAEVDQHGNYHKRIGDNPTTLWSCHTDSVHRGEGRQNVEFDGKYAKLPGNSKSSCLGADDAAGMWLATQMIKHKVPGHYIFHAAEEIGCQGSKAIAEKTPNMLAGINAAIAFDRRGTKSVITVQGMRTCSDAFGNSLASQLKDYELDPTGTVTDTKQYRGIIAECTNVSVGYYDEHRATERLDVPHLIRLRDEMITIDQSMFVIERNPYAKEDFGYGQGRFRGWEDLDRPLGKKLGVADLFGARNNTLADLLWSYPDECAAVLQRGGVTLESLSRLVNQERDERNAAHYRRDAGTAPKPKKRLKANPEMKHGLVIHDGGQSKN